MINLLVLLLSAVIRKLHNPAVKIFIIRIFGAVVAYVSQLIIARWLTPHDNGIYIQYMSILAILIPVFTLGFETSPQFFINQYKEKKYYSKILGFIRSTKLISLLLSLFFIAACYATSFVFEIENNTLHALLLIGLIAIPWALIEIQGGIARCWNWMWLAIAPSYLFRFLVLALVCSLYLIRYHNSSYVEALELTLFSTSLVFVAQYIFLKKAIKKAIPNRTKLEYQNINWIKYGIPVAISNMLYIALAFSDVLIIGQLFTPQDVAVYFIASKTIIISTFIMYAIGVSASQKFSQHYANNNHIELQNTVISATRNSVFFTVLTSSFLMIFGYWILYLFGKIYLEGYPYIILLSIAPIIRASIGPADRLMIMAKAEKAMAKNVFIILVITIACQLSGALLMGVLGVAIGSIIACILETIIVRNSAKKNLSIECFFFFQKKILIEKTKDHTVNINIYNNIFFIEKYIKTSYNYLIALKFSPFMLSIYNKKNDDYLGEIPIISRKFLGLNIMSVAVHKSAVLGTPIIVKGEEYKFCSAMLKTLKSEYKCSIFKAYCLNNTEFNTALIETIKLQNYHIIHKNLHTRAILDISSAKNGAEYINKNISANSLKEYRRLNRRLSEIGTVEIIIHKNKDAIISALARYMDLEKNSWKGKKNKLSKNTPENNLYFSEFIHTLSDNNNVHIMELSVNNIIIASGIVLINNEVAYYYKTSFDENYKKFSPGVLLTLEITKYVFTLPNLKYVDSCATQNHTMINKIWRQRQELLDIIITPYAPYSIKWCASKIYIALIIHGRAYLKYLYLKVYKNYPN